MKKQKSPPSKSYRLNEQVRQDSIVDELFQIIPSNIQTPSLKELEIRTSKCSKATIQQVNYLLQEVLQYPSTEVAERHSKANRLGLTDVLEFQKVHPEVRGNKYEHCEDCGLIVKKQSIPLCTSFNDFPNIGIGAYLLFSTVKNLTILLLILGLIYSSYSLYANITEPSSVLSTSNFPLKLSYVSILQNYTSNSSLESVVMIQGYLMVAVLLSWMVSLFIINYFQIANKRMVDNNTVTAADFSIMLENVPYEITQQQMQQEFDRYHQELIDKRFIKDINGSHGQIERFVIRKYNKAVPFHLLEEEELNEEIDKLEDQLKEKRQLFIKWIDVVKEKGQLPSSQAQRKVKYREYIELRKQKTKKQNISNFPAKKKSNKSHINQTTVFITFQHSQSANYLGQVNPQSFSQKISYYLSCCSTAHYFSCSTYARSQPVKLSRAPEPEDINWNNIGVNFGSIVLRKCLTYLVTAMLLGASFGIVYGLTMIQLSTKNEILSYAMILSITIINVLINLAIEGLTYYQRDFTRTNREISYALKSIIAQLMNSILVPTISNIYIKQNLFDESGLVEEIFFLAISNSVVPPILQFINIGHIVNRILAWLNSRPGNKLKLDQEELNKALELRMFQLGYPYIYYMNSFYFTCFYITMQPYIVLPTLIGFFLMFWADKYRLLNKSQRPIPSSELLNDAMGQLILLSPFMLTLGKLTWYKLITDVDFGSFIQIFQFATLGVCVAFYLIPMDSLLDCCCSIPDDQILSYDQCRGKLTSEYDRLNPATKEEGLKVFMNFLAGERKKGKKDGFGQNQNIFARLLNKIEDGNNVNDRSMDELQVETEANYNSTNNYQSQLVGKLFNYDDQNDRKHVQVSHSRQNLFKELPIPPTPQKKAAQPRKISRPKRQISSQQYSTFKANMRGYLSQPSKNKSLSNSYSPYEQLQF